MPNANRPHFPANLPAGLLLERHVAATSQPSDDGILPPPMAIERHLILQEVNLRPSGEWTAPVAGWTVVRVADGVGYWLQGGGGREIKAGDGFAAAGSSRLLLRASQLGPLKLQFYGVRPEYLITIAEGHQLEQVVKTAVAQIIPFAATDGIGQKFTRLAGQTQRESLATRSALLQLWSQAVTGVLHLPAASDRSHKLRERFQHLIARMPDAELATRPLAELAGQIHCSERHFSRLFREEFGVSLRTRQTELRMVRARQLLADNQTKIINVAYESGYRHLGLFNVMFKRRFGMTPTEWRQQNLPASSKNLFKRASTSMAMLLVLLETFIASPALALTSDTSQWRRRIDKPGGG
jgi:AraC-like DNA-binding protein